MAITPRTLAQSFKTLYSFTGGNDGVLPQGPLILDEQGNLYGEALYSANGIGNGTIYRYGSDRRFTLLYSFPGQGGNGQKGANPSGGLLRDNHGNLYGVTQDGGEGQYVPFGVVFKLDSGGKETVLHHFAGPPGDGATPLGGMLQGRHGVFYGTTAMGGSGECRGGQQICGTVFALDHGKESVLHNFQGGPQDGLEPSANLVQDAQGNLYGTTVGGGEAYGMGCGGILFGCGTVFELSPQSGGDWAEKVLYSFTGGDDGYFPQTIAIDSQNNLYGTALYGGNPACGGGCGTIYKLGPSGDFTVLHSFTGGRDGYGPYFVLLDNSGNIYGAANFVVFKLDTANKISVLHRFPTARKSANSLTLAGNGTLYGTTAQGGKDNSGTIFMLKP